MEHAFLLRVSVSSLFLVSLSRSSMNTVEEKLRRGFGLVERAESDSDLLGVGLLAIHSALEDHMRGELSNHPAVGEAERQRLIRRELGWNMLVDLAQQHLGLTDEQRKLVLGAQEVRRSFIQGNPFRWRVGDVLRYGRFVETFCGIEGMLDEVLIERRAERRNRPLPTAAPAPAAPESTGNSFLWNIIRLAIVVGVFGAIGAGLFATYQWVRDELLPELSPQSAVSAPTSAVAPVAAPSPVTRTARIVNLGGGPGWLHEQPNFSSATLPPRLSEGDVVNLVNEPPVDADGTTWVLVEAQGYRGWSPANNVQVTGS